MALHRRKTIVSPVAEEPFDPSPTVILFSGGTAVNSICSELATWTHRITHVLPVSDDGGSTKEIIRVLSGPAVGDIRARALRLSDESSPEAIAVKRLLGYRLGDNASEAKSEWYSIVEGRHGLWKGISRPYADTIRSFLVYFQNQLLRADSDESPFNFSKGSIGNFFFAGAIRFFRSVEAAIFVYSRVSHIHPDSLVCPSIVTNDRLNLGAELMDGTVIVGQNQISHPTSDKCDQGPAIGRIKRVFYISSNMSTKIHEVVFPCNPVILENLSEVDAIVYGMGSLFTSLCPSLILQGCGEAIAKRPNTVPKIFCLNGTWDRETNGMTAIDFIQALTDALNRRDSESLNIEKRDNTDRRDAQATLNRDEKDNELFYPPLRYCNVLLAPKNGEVLVDEEKIASLGIRLIWVDSYDSPGYGKKDVRYQAKALVETLKAIVDEMRQ